MSPEVSEIITKAINVARYVKAEYKVKADCAMANNEGTGGWTLDNGYKNNENICKNAARCVDLTEVLARLQSIASLARIEENKLTTDGIKMQWRQAMYYFTGKNDGQNI